MQNKIYVGRNIEFCLNKFTEVTNQSASGQYPPKTLYLHICGLNRYLTDEKHDNNFNVLEKANGHILDSRDYTFPRVYINLQR